MAPSPGPSARPDPDRAVGLLAMQVGATSVTRMTPADVAAMLSSVCAALPGAVGVAAAALVLVEPADPRDPDERHVFASDEASERLGLMQQRSGRGPVPAAVRGDRPLVVPDLTVSGPPELAAAAADCGLVRSLVVPVPVGGGLQLLAGAGSALDESTATVVEPLVAALCARLADVREIARLQRAGAGGAREGYTDVPAGDDVDGEHRAPDTPTDAATTDTATTDTATTALPVVPAAARSDPARSDPEQAAPEHPDPEQSRPVDGAAGITAAPDPAPVEQDTVRLGAHPGPERDPGTDLFATSEPDPDTPPIGQAGLGWDDVEHAPAPLPVRLPARVRIAGRRPRPSPLPRAGSAAAVPMAAVTAVPVGAGVSGAFGAGAVGSTAVPQQRSAPGPAGDGHPANGHDEPTGRVARHRLRDDR